MGRTAPGPEALHGPPGGPSRAPDQQPPSGGSHDSNGGVPSAPRVPPPGPRGLGPHERAVVLETRRHHPHPIPLGFLAMRLPDVPRRAVRHHLDRLILSGLIELASDPGTLPGYRWRANAPASVYDDLPIGTCPRCGSHAAPGGGLPHPETAGDEGP